MSEKSIAISNQTGGLPVAVVDAGARDAGGVARVVQLMSLAHRCELEKYKMQDIYGITTKPWYNVDICTTTFDNSDYGPALEIGGIDIYNSPLQYDGDTLTVKAYYQVIPGTEAGLLTLEVYSKPIGESDNQLILRVLDSPVEGGLYSETPFYGVGITNDYNCTGYIALYDLSTGTLTWGMEYANTKPCADATRIQIIAWVGAADDTALTKFQELSVRPLFLDKNRKVQGFGQKITFLPSDMKLMTDGTGQLCSAMMSVDTQGAGHICFIVDNYDWDDPDPYNNLNAWGAVSIAVG